MKEVNFWIIECFSSVPDVSTTDSVFRDGGGRVDNLTGLVYVRLLSMSRISEC